MASDDELTPYVRHEEDWVLWALDCFVPQQSPWRESTVRLLNEKHDVILGDHTENPIDVPDLEWSPLLKLVLIPNEQRSLVTLLGRWAVACPSQSQGANDPDFQTLLQHYRQTTRASVVRLLSAQSFESADLRSSNPPFPIGLPFVDAKDGDDTKDESPEKSLAEVAGYLCTQNTTRIPPLEGREQLRPQGTTFPSVTLKALTGWQVLLHIVIPFMRAVMGIPAPEFPFGQNPLPAVVRQNRFEEQIQQAYRRATQILDQVMTAPDPPPLRCADLIASILAVADHWQWRRQWCETQVDRLKRSRNAQCLITTGDVLRGYTYQLDALLNTYLRRGRDEVPLDVWYRLFIQGSKDPSPYTPDKDALVREHMAYYQNQRRQSPYPELVTDPRCITKEDLKLFQQKLDRFFERQAVGLTDNPCYLFRRVTDWRYVSDPCTQAYTSTTRNWDLLPSALFAQDDTVTYADLDTDEKRAALQQWWQAQGLTWAQGDNRWSEVPANPPWRCCFMVLRVAAGIRMAVMGPGTSHFDEAEVLLPRHLTLTLRRTAALCSSRDARPQVIFFVDVTRAVATDPRGSSAGKRKDTDAITTEETPAKFSATE